MSWQARHEGSPRAVQGLTLEDIVNELRNGRWEPTDEVMGPGDRVWVAIENHLQLAEYAAELEPPPRRREEPTTLDMTALIDVCLVLLIFFILTTTYAAAVQKVVPMPSVKSDEGKARTVRTEDIKKRMIRLQVHGDKGGGPVSFRLENQPVAVLAEDGKTLDGDKLRDALRPYVRGENGKHEVLLDARDISWGMVIAIQDAAKSAGVRTVHHVLRK